VRELVRSSVTAGIAIAAAGALAIAPAALPADTQAPPIAHVRLSASTAATPAVPPPGGLIAQFLLNQLQNCSIICPFILQGVTQVPVKFALIPLTFVGELQSAPTLLQAIALTDATVSGSADAAINGIITNDLGQVLPRAQHALEVAVVGLIDVGTTAVTQPANLLQAINTVRADVFGALMAKPGPETPPAVHNALEAAAVRAIEVASAFTFQAPEQLLLGAADAANALFSTLGETGNVGAALGAVGTSVSATLGESLTFIDHAVTEPIPVSPAPAAMTTARARKTPTTQPPVATRSVLRPSFKAGVNTVSVPDAGRTVHRAPGALGTINHPNPKKSGH